MDGLKKYLVIAVVVLAVMYIVYHVSTLKSFVTGAA
jgi:hypothetical protein